MGRKIPSLITGMKVDRATFHNAPIEKLSFPATVHKQP